METLFIGRNCIRLNETESTNTYAINLLKEVKVPEGTLIITENQTKGRGQRGASWLAAPGENITCSLIIYPEFLSVNEHFLLSKIIALSIQKTIQHFLLNDKNEVKIKWPNDIMVNGQKISGILIENSIQDSRLKYSVIGFGINVNQTSFGELNDIATSLSLYNKQKLNCEIIIQYLCEVFESFYLKLRLNKHQLINDTYLSNLLFFGTYFQFKDFTTGEISIGKTINVENNGVICIAISRKHEIRKYSLKEISFLKT